jgi:hypothetical protein
MLVAVHEPKEQGDDASNKQAENEGDEELGAVPLLVVGWVRAVVSGDGGHRGERVEGQRG